MATWAWSSSVQRGARAPFTRSAARPSRRTRRRRVARLCRYVDAQATKLKADQLEAWEKAKIENELQVVYATKELQMKRAQARELEALHKRIQRGRDEHKASGRAAPRRAGAASRTPALAPLVLLAPACAGWRRYLRLQLRRLTCACSRNARVRACAGALAQRRAAADAKPPQHAERPADKAEH